MTGVRTPAATGQPAQREPQPGGPRRTGGTPAAPFGVLGWARWVWRQLTSMRTALVLLFLLAVASVPGSVLPQEGIDPQAVQQYYVAHPSLAPLLARLSLFSVFAAPWFAAIYLLLFASLAGCVIPRTFRLAGSARQQPPRAPANLSRLPLTARYETALAPDEALAAAAALLAGKRFRLRTGDGWVAAEKGYLREAGNLLFHLALLGVLVAVCVGGMFGYKANRLLVVGDSFANTATDLDAFHPGRAVSATDLQPFTITLGKFEASYVTSGALRGQPSRFDALIRYSAQPGAPMHGYQLRVNHPLAVDGVRVFLIGHGYAPVFRVTDGTGRVVFDGPVPFIAVEQAGLTSEGVIKVPDAHPQQLGFAGVFLPTAVDVGGKLGSAFPAPLNPAVSLVSYAGNLGMDSGPAQSVYQLDTSGLRQLPIRPRPLAPGQSMKLPDGDGTLTFTGYRQWISLAITYDPGTLPALIAGMTALAGLLLSFFVRRRRMFVRAAAAPGGRTVVELGGLARSDAAGGFESEFATLSGEISSAHQARAPAVLEQGPGPGPSGPPAADDPTEGE
ncbi:MAG TPA: cytochrome c biogenesis protein ResB [Streptosporangiaceae bacterium]|nr:cytochrome c biogenesis protein ResB [Streptosporangiaceae bacterium]